MIRTLAFSKDVCNNVTGYMMTKKSSSITIRDVARKAGVSVATVSRYINNNPVVAGDTAARLERVLHDLDYVPHAAARNLATRKTRIIGLLMADIRADFYAPLLRGIDSVVHDHGYNLIVSSYHQNMTEMITLPIGPQNTDGVLVFADSLSDVALQELRRKNFPIVLIHRSSPPAMNIPCITVENKASSCKLIDHLIEVHNRKRIAFVRGPEKQEDSNWREQGYKESLVKHSLPVDPRLIIEGEFDRIVARKAVLSLMRGDPGSCDAIFCGDDDAAIGVLRALQELDVKVPSQISVVGFDDQSFSAYLEPALTTVRAPTEAVGFKAAEVLFSLIAGEPVEPLLLLPTEIVYRQSCGCV